jgi:hypothetical protein
MTFIWMKKGWSCNLVFCNVHFENKSIVFNFKCNSASMIFLCIFFSLIVYIFKYSYLLEPRVEGCKVILHFGASTKRWYCYLGGDVFFAYIELHLRIDKLWRNSDKKLMTYVQNKKSFKSQGLQLCF